jgi:hypothetical protein
MRLTKRKYRFRLVAMQITRLYTDDNGGSLFEAHDLPLHDHGEIGRLSERIDAKAVIFRETGGDYDYDFHNAPERQFIIMLDGITEIETSLGERRRFSAGDILLVEDTTGKGHRSRSVDGQPRRSVFVPLSEQELRPNVVGEA